MPRPVTKADLLTESNKQFEKIWTLIDTMTDEVQNTNFNFGSDPGKEAHWKRDKNIRDVLAHLYEWHLLLIKWVEANTNGEAKPFLPEPYNWKTYGDMNVMFWERHQSTPYSDIKKMLTDSHNRVTELIEGFSDDELFTKKHFPWTGTSSFGSYCISVTSSHYDWAMSKIKKHIKTCNI